ncbi:PAS domain S-box protein [Leptolyngbya iicbica]|uniref:histidine kinase n=2 Tax=Cyanophyceae TaxID=3028117 RepID=A0A4Q7E198_9CYAN|nr:PAS domain S-box protein [Leptolyngbya sp. LK]RZM75718.1 PAS domain S-box protein [Leptolyngbya sp. LK]
MLALLPNTASYIPHGHCYLWQTPLVTLHVAADSLIAIAYFSIPLLLIYFIRQRRDLPFPGIFWLFSGFIVSCGITHLFAIWTLWHPTYWLSGAAKAFTAWISITTAIWLLPSLRKALALPSLTEMRNLNENLRQEIDDRKQIEIALKKSELKFRGIFDQMYQFIGLLTPEGILLEANRAALEFGGTEIEAVRGKPFWEIVWWQISPQTQARLREAIAQAAQGEFVRYEVEVQGANGAVITIDFSLRPVLDEAGQVVLLIPEGRDISDRIQAEKALQLQAVITRNMAEGICLVRADNGIIVYANPKFERMFGYDSGELNGQPVAVVNHPDAAMSPEVVMGSIRDLVLAKKEATYEVYNIKKDGTPVWCEATTAVFDHPDYGTVLVAVQQDISDRKTAEAQAQIKASLEEKELLLKEIYHRVKNNLQVIFSLLNLQANNLDDAHAKAALRESQNRIIAMSLVHEKLYQSSDLAHIELSDYVTSLAKSLLETYRFEVSKVSLDIKIAHCCLDIETAIPCGLILNELITNSLKYAYPQGQPGILSIESKSSDARRIVLTIRDNGIGLSPGFDLQQISSLGLQLVRNLAKQLRGEIQIVPSSLGTEFELSFPQP